MTERSIQQRVLDLLHAIPELKELTQNPSIFSDDIEGHDCDKCPAGEYNQGDTFDPGVCEDCWERAIVKAFEEWFDNPEQVSRDAFIMKWGGG